MKLKTARRRRRWTDGRRSRASESIGTDGVFHDNGYVGGVVPSPPPPTVAPRSIRSPRRGNTDPGSLLPPISRRLSRRWTILHSMLYPYDQTVFRAASGAACCSSAGRPPTQCTSKSPHHIQLQAFATGGPPLRVTLPEPVWKGGEPHRRRDGHDLREATEAIGATSRRHPRNRGTSRRQP